MKRKNELKKVIAAINITLLMASLDVFAAEKNYTCSMNTMYGDVEIPVRAESVESAEKIAADQLEKNYTITYVTCSENK